MTVSPVGGGLEANVNRWRGQVGLQPLAGAELLREMTPIEIDGARGYLVELTRGSGPGILGALVEHKGQPWIFKMTGPAELVGKQRAAFEAFVKSVRFEGAGR